MPKGHGKRLPDVSKLFTMPAHIQEQIVHASFKLDDVSMDDKGAHKVMESFKHSRRFLSYEKTRERMLQKLASKNKQLL